MHAIERAILAQYPSATVSGEPTPHRSGALEVVVGTQLVHSKLNGDGYVDAPEKIERMCVCEDASRRERVLARRR